MLRPAVSSSWLRNLNQENPMTVIHYIGFDVHKKTISYCVKAADGRIIQQGKLAATRPALHEWAKAQRVPWHGAMEATLFSAWIYDTLKPYAERLVMGHPAGMKAITAGKKKSDSIDARTIADLLRCDLLPTCYVMAPEMRDLRRLLRYRNMVVQQSVRMQNKMAGLLMETGTAFHKDKLHGKKYFSELIKSLEEVPESVKDLLRMSRGSMEMFESTQKQIINRLLSEPTLEQRVERLMSIRAVGPITALTWALEIADPHRFASIADAVSYCGLTAAFRSSAGKQQRGPISKQRNAWLQTVLIEEPQSRSGVLPPVRSSTPTLPSAAQIQLPHFLEDDASNKTSAKPVPRARGRTPTHSCRSALALKSAPAISPLPLFHAFSSQPA
jgi:transposase